MVVIFFDYNGNYSGKIAKKRVSAIKFAIGPRATNMAKWGIPEKSYKNVAQQC